MGIHRIIVEQVPLITQIVDVHVIPVIRMTAVGDIVSTIEGCTHVNHNRVESVLFLEVTVRRFAHMVDGYHVINLDHRAVLLRLIRLDVKEGAIDIEHQVRGILDNRALLGQSRVTPTTQRLSIIRLNSKGSESQRLHGECCHFGNVNGVVEEQRRILKNDTRLVNDHIL